MCERQQTDSKVTRSISDEEFYKLMDEAASFTSPKQLKVLFSVIFILLFCNPVSHKELYTAFKLSLCEDFKYRFKMQAFTRIQKI